MAGKKRNTIPLTTTEWLLKKAGAARISPGAKKALAEALEKTALEIAKKAVKLAKHGRRKTVKAADIELACEENKGF